MRHSIFWAATLIFTVIFNGLSARAETNYSLDFRDRTKPSQFNIVGQAAYDGMLWGEREAGNPKYGYYRVGVRGLGNPTYAGFIQVAPIAPLVFEVQRGRTVRFIPNTNFNCDDYACRGKIDRTDYSVKLALGYEQFVLLGGATWREIQTENESRFVVLEENFLVTPGFHRYFETFALLGYKLPENRMAGIVYTSGLLSEGDRQLSAAYAIYRFKWQEYALSVGAGTYKTDNVRPSGPNPKVDDTKLDGFSAIFSITRSWGDSLSLF